MTVVVKEYEERLRSEEWDRRCAQSRPSGWWTFGALPPMPPIPVAPWECEVDMMDDGDLYGAAFTFNRRMVAQDLGV